MQALMSDIPQEIIDAMYPTSEEQTTPISSSKGIAYIGTSTKLIQTQHNLCETTGMGAIDTPKISGTFKEQLGQIQKWLSEVTPFAILFDDPMLAAGVAQMIDKPLLRAKQLEYDTELQRIRTKAPLYNVLTEEAAAKDTPQILLLL